MHEWVMAAFMPSVGKVAAAQPCSYNLPCFTKLPRFWTVDRTERALDRQRSTGLLSLKPVN
ncbi:hypothetical protein [Novosphingobium pentaromativorans]|uniref:Uncharacterized protein n=2 Tax=Novosphingobium pentaromativorans TaxID=205844 RepID=G6EG33_9SPHN|nr:hypothetical protein [Novosphingobium pentaromativorans]EHJ59722.1 hypothetical protein NSU_3304 [Novosphingobium pentaromativorans US6-1]